jgi:protein gp37
LTKRPQNWAARLEEIAHSVAGFNSLLYSWVIEWLDRAAPRNVWIGTTVEDQVRADERIPALLKIPARVRFLSCEPLLGPVNLHAGVKRPEGYRGYFDWVICGGESGPGARPMHPEWARNLRDQCAAAGVPFFFKQWGEWVPWSRDLGDITGMESDHVMLNGSKYFPCNFGSSLKRWSVSASTPPAAS